MSIEQEDGEVIEGFGMQEFHLISNSVKEEQNKNVNDATMQRSEDKWRKLVNGPFHKVVSEVYKDVQQSAKGSNNGIYRMPVLPILPNPVSNNYDWKTLSSWYQDLCDGEKRVLKKEGSTFCLLLSRIPNGIPFHACLIAPDSRIIFDVCVDYPQQLYPLVSLIPVLEGVMEQNSSRITFDQLQMQLKNALSSVPSKLLVYSLSRELLHALGLDQISTLCIRDLNRFPLHTRSNNIPRVIHNLFVNPSTQITIPNPLGALIQYLNQLHLSIQWLDIPIPSQSSIKWVRYSIFYRKIPLMTGYCIVPRSDQSKQLAAFAVLRHMWGTPCPMLYQGVPSREELKVLDQFILCVSGKIKYSLPQTTALLVYLYRFYQSEFEYSLSCFAPKEKPVESPPVPISMPTPSPLSLIEPSQSGKRGREESTPTQQIISLPDLTFTSSSVENDARLILIVDIDLTIVHAIHDDESIQRFNLWLDEGSVSTDENDWKQDLRVQLESVEVSYIDENGNNRFSNLLLKIRPGVQHFISTLAQHYELIIYTQGEEQYAKQVISILDPEGIYFKGRFIARCDSNDSQKKGFQRILECWNNSMNDQLELAQLCTRLLIIDDKEDVWESSFHEETVLDPQNCIVKCFPYFFFNTKTDAYSYHHLKPYEIIEKEYMERLTEIFCEVATEYYKKPSDIRSLLRKQKRQVLRGLRLAFTSIIEKSEVLENNILFKSLVEFGGVYVNAVEDDCDLLICRNLRTAKVNTAQQNHIPVVSVRWLEECVKYWKLTSLDPFYMDFAQDVNQTAIMGKSAIVTYHQKVKDMANTTLFTVTDPPRSFLSLLQGDKQIFLKDFDEDILNEIKEDSFEEKRRKIADAKNQFSPSVNVVLGVPQSSNMRIVPFNTYTCLLQTTVIIIKPISS